MRSVSLLLASLLLTSCDSHPAQQSNPRAASVTLALAVASDSPASPSILPATDSLRTFRWEDVCTNLGTYDPKAYTRQQLAGTYQMMLGFGGLPSSLYLSLPDTDNTAESFQSLTALLRQQHDSLARVLRGTEVVPTAFWQQFKRLRKLQLAEQYEQAQVELIAYFRPASLRATRYYPSCARYADALASTDTAVVLRGWRQLIAEEKMNNADPEQFDRQYAEAVASSNGVRYAKMQLLTYGWHNCTNKHSKYNDLEKYQPGRRFEQLFYRIRQSNCADTD